jgi:hypothetical protein
VQYQKVIFLSALPEDNVRMDIFETRKKNLNVRIADMGGQAVFIDATGMNQGQVSSLQNGGKNIGEKLARGIEQKAGWPKGCLDSDLPMDPIGQINAALEAASWLTPAERANVIALLTSMKESRT